MSGDFLGFSYEKYVLSSHLFDADNTALVELFLKLGPGILRIGGSSVSQTIWDPLGPGGISYTIAPKDLDRLAGFLKKTNWQVIYGLNAIPERSSYTLTAQEAEQASSKLGDALIYFEIGNEPDEYFANNFEPETYNFKDFLKDWQQYHDHIKKLVPNALFLGPSAGGSMETYTIPFAEQAHHDIALLTQHYYCGNGKDPSSTMDFLLGQAIKKAQSNISNLHDKTSHDVPNLRITETNSFYGGGANGVSNAFGAALWLIEYSFTLRQSGAIGANFHGGGSAHYTPITNDADGVVKHVNPDYYGMLFVSMMIPGNLLAAPVTGTANDLHAYATLKADGSIALALINNSSEDSVSATVNLPPSSFSSATAMLLTADSLDATTGFTFGGASIHNDGTWSASDIYTATIENMSFQISVPAASAYLIQLQPSKKKHDYHRNSQPQTGF